MGYKAIINNNEYKLKTGFTLKDELNETLDSGLIIFNTYGEEIDAVPFDLVTVEGYGGLIYDRLMLLDSYNDDIYAFNNSYDDCDHTYTMTLFSRTKDLERIALPNCSVTQPINGGTKRTVLEEIKRFCNLYVPKMRVATSYGHTFESKYELSQNVGDMFSNIECPEFQWNRPTLREVLNDLMSTKDCVAYINKYGEIDYIDMRVKGNEIDTSTLVYSKKSVNSADYVGELSIDMQNALGKNRTSCVEYLTLRAPEGSTTLTTENAIFRTQHPIYNVRRITAYYRYRSDATGNTYYWVSYPITEFVKEKEEWELLSSVKIGSTAYLNLETISILGRPIKTHKVNFIYFERGNNTIENFGKLWDAIGSDEYFADQIVFKQPSGNYNNKNKEVRELLLEVEYDTIGEHSMNVGKYLPTEHPENQIIDSQTNSYVDIEHQSIYEYAKANRLSSKIREIGGIYPSESYVPQLGDKIGDEILFSREISCWDDHIQFKGLLAPNYVLKDFFTGVKAKKREWQIAKNEDALTRHDVYKLYFEASFSQKYDNINLFESSLRLEGISFHGIMPISYFLASALESYRNTRIKYAIAYTRSNNGKFYPDDNEYGDNGIIMEVDNEVQGMSLCFNFGFMDNFKAGDYIVKEDNEYKQNFYQYADENGEFLEMMVTLTNDIYGVGDGEHELPVTGVSESLAESILATQLAKPKINIDKATRHQEAVFEIGLNVNKDNREITQNTIQFEYCSDTPDIVVTKRFIELCGLFNRTSNEMGDLRLHYYYYQHKYELSDTIDNGGNFELLSSYGLTFDTLDEGTVRITMNRAYGMRIYGWSITDANGNILFAVNGNNRTIYFNLLRLRDTNIYNTDKKTIVGNIERE